MTINVANLFKSQTAKTFDKSKIGQDVHVGDRFPSADVCLYSGKKIFKAGTTTTVVDDNLSKPKPLEHVKAGHSSSLLHVCADIHVGRQKGVLSKVKLAKNNITKLFKPTGRVSAAVPRTDPFAIPGVEHGTTTDHSSSLCSPSILQHAEPKVCVATMHESTPPGRTNLEAIASPIVYGENVVNRRIEDLTTFCSLAEVSFPSSTGQLFTTPKSQLGTFLSASFLGGLHTIKEEDGNAEVVVGVVNTKREELATSGSYISWSNSGSEVTAYLSSDTLSDHTTTHEPGLVSSETNTSPVDTSFATSVDAEDSHQSSPGAPRGLRRVPSYEDLRNLRTTANRDSSCSDMSCGSSDCDSPYRAAFGNTAPLRRLRNCNDLRKSFLSLEPKICAPLTRQTNKCRKFRPWLGTRRHESSLNIQKTTASRAPSEILKVTPAVSRSRQFLQNIFRPSSRVQAHVPKPSPHPPSLPSSPPVWSCAKITRSSSKGKRRRRMTKQAMKELKARLDSMDIDPWY